MKPSIIIDQTINNLSDIERETIEVMYQLCKEHDIVIRLDPFAGITVRKDESVKHILVEKSFKEFDRRCQDVPLIEEGLKRREELNTITKHTLAGYKNRHLTPMPDFACNIMIIKECTEGSRQVLCMWKPYKKERYPRDDQPREGYLGTAKPIGTDNKGYGFNAWKQNDSEFIYYKIIQ